MSETRIDIVRRCVAEERPLQVGVEWVRELAEEIADLETRLAAEVHNIVAGAIFDFAGYLTTRDDVLPFGASADASPMVERIIAWAKVRGLSIEAPEVAKWQDRLAIPAAEGAGVPDLNNIIGNDGREWPQTFDGMAWATAFNRQFPSVSVDDALSWFCNAIMRGYDTHAQKQPAAVVELDEWRVVDNANRTVQTYETETAATGQPTSVFLATLDKRLPDRAPHRVMRVCLTEVDV